MASEGASDSSDASLRAPLIDGDVSHSTSRQGPDDLEAGTTLSARPVRVVRDQHDQQQTTQVHREEPLSPRCRGQVVCYTSVSTHACCIIIRGGRTLTTPIITYSVPGGGDLLCLADPVAKKHIHIIPINSIL